MDAIHETVGRKMHDPVLTDRGVKNGRPTCGEVEGIKTLRLRHQCIDRLRLGTAEPKAP